MNMPDGPLNPAQREILCHAAYRSAGGRYCGDSPDMQSLVADGLMRSCGKVAWCPDEYFTITDKGRASMAAKEYPHA